MVRAVRTSTLCATVGLAPSTLSYWVRVGVVKPSLIGSTGKRYERWWSLDDVISVRTVKALRDSGCPLQKVRKAVTLLRSLPSPLAANRLVWDGEDVFIQDQLGTVVSALRRPGQLVIQATVLPLGQWENEGDHLAEDLNVRREQLRRKTSRSRRTSTARLTS